MEKDGYLEIYLGNKLVNTIRKEALLFANAGQKINAAKIFHSFFFIAKLLEQRQFRAVFLLIRGVLFAIAGRKIPQTDFAEIRAGLFGIPLEDSSKATLKFHYRGQIMVFASDSKTPFPIYLLPDIIILNQYCVGREIIGKNVVDAGANAGVFAIYAALMGAKRVYAFEPVKETYSDLEKNIKINGLEGKVIPVCMALGSKNGKGRIFYDSALDGSASMVLGGNKARSQNVKITSIDRFMRNRGKVAFIKADVEGFEKDVLQGAKETIKKDKPILSLSAYHLPDDKESLPKLVKSIRNDYSCRLMELGDEILYFS